MTTTKSFFKSGRLPRLYTAALRRNVPFFITCGILLFVAIVLPYIVSSPSHLHDYDFGIVGDSTGRLAEYLQNYYTGIFQYGVYLNIGQTGVVAYLLAIMAFASALVASRYLHSQKTTDLFHSLPVRRGQLMVSNMLAALTAILLPYAVLYFGTMLYQLAAYARYGCFGLAYMQFIVSDFLLTILFVCVIYLFTTFIAVNVGTTFDALLIAGGLGFAPTILYLSLGALREVFQYGAYFVSRSSLRISPFLFFADIFLRADETYIQNFGFANYWAYNPDFKGNAILFAVWLVIAALLFAASLLCYRRRKSEIAGQTQTNGVFQTICKVMASFCGALVMLAVFFTGGAITWIIAMLLGGVAVGVIAELILSRTPKFLLKNLKWLIGGGVLCIVTVFVVRLDLTGYATRVPAIDQVASVQVKYTGRYGNNLHIESRQSNYENYMYDYGSTLLTEPEAIAVVLQAHLEAVQNQPPGRTDWSRYDHGNYPYVYTRVVYTMKNGSTMTRSFQQMNMDSYLTLSALEGNEEFIRKNNPIFVLDDELPAQEEFVRSVAFVDALGNETALRLSREEIRELIDAMKQDIVSESLESITDPGNSPHGFVKIRYRKALDDQGIWLSTHENASWVQVTDEYTATLPLLRRHGVDLAGADAAAVEKVYLFDLYEYYGWYGSYFRVVEPSMESFTNSPYDYYVRRYNEYDEYDDHYNYLEVDAAADIQTVFAGGFNQLLLSPYNLKETVMAVYGTGDEYYMQFVSIADLPASLREEAQAMVDNRGYDYGYTVIYDDFGLDAWEAEEAAAIGIIGGADGPTAIYVTEEAY